MSTYELAHFHKHDGKRLKFYSPDELYVVWCSFDFTAKKLFACFFFKLSYVYN